VSWRPNHKQREAVPRLNALFSRTPSAGFLVEVPAQRCGFPQVIVQFGEIAQGRRRAHALHCGFLFLFSAKSAKMPQQRFKCC
jgi:hypothetical protein